MSQLCLSLSFLFLFFISMPIKTISEDINTERTILLKLRKQLGNPPSIGSWNSSSSPCEWPEINCTAGSVTEVHLRDKNITERVPPMICDLKNLTYIDFAYNYIPGEFPILYKCSKLQVLDISQNYFVGPIPDEIDRLSTLVYLDIGGNNFSGNIPPSIGRLPELKTLILVQNQFDGTFPKEIGNLANLEVLEMAYNEFVPMKIPQEFGKLSKLWYLWMTRTNLIGEIPESFNNLSNLEHLDLARNNLEGPIPSRVFLLKNLTRVYLFHNRLSGEIPKNVNAMNLIEIDLSQNNLTGSIPEDFGKLQYLESLDLIENQLTGELPTSIARLPALKDFRVFTNKLSGVLPPEFGLHSQLEGFEVSENQFSGQLPENLCAGGVLQGVVAFTNNLSGRIPESLGNCPTLRVVELHNNRFSGEIPRGLWTAFNLSTLQLSNNSFSGKLPSKLAWNMSRVEISDNKFSGEIPTGIASWSNLVVFQASNNLFSGKIPKEITVLSRLSVLLLDGNNFSGELPSEIISWRSLTKFNVSNNKLSGEIPAAIGYLPDLLDLDLSENQFSGEIPPQIGNLKPTSLNLSSNQLVGRIPNQFNNLAYESSFSKNSDLCADHPVLKLPDCSKVHQPKKLSSRYLAMIVALAILLSLVILLLSFFLVRDYRRKNHGEYLATWKLTSFQRLGFTKRNILSKLTDNNLIGSGGSGKVYRIVINRSGESIAVKKIWNSNKVDHKLEKEFLAEVEILSNIRHSNIVKLLCCISSEVSKLLVYEYMENRSLDRWLHGNKRSSTLGMSSVHHVVLDWPRRLQIAVGAAHGLCYMHHECQTPIIHRDVKSSNILLDSEFKAKIADFGLAKMLTRDASSHTMSSVAGSFGYLAPEYAYTTKVNAKVDVYSFGVVLLELVTGREANNADENMSLVEWAWQYLSEDKPIVEMLDTEVKETAYLEEMILVCKAGILCTNALPSNRPSMKEVSNILRSCCLPDGHAVKKVGSNFDVSTVLGRKRSEKEFEEDDMIYDV